MPDGEYVKTQQGISPEINTTKQYTFWFFFDKSILVCMINNSAEKRQEGRKLMFLKNEKSYNLP